MRTRTIFGLALAIGLAGVAVRLALPVSPVDQAMRDVIRYYGSLSPADRP